ncbi:hypothetical protein IW150_005394 [Coemansia sp. RSA 2607]|nr:hypothetical protein IW150_005394 [Coemansia sp. RSA 2607]
MAFLGVPQVATYNASKAALAIFHESLRLEIENHLGASHVRTSAVFPSMVETGMFNGVRMPRWISPELPPKLVAQRIFDQIESGCDGDIYLPLFTNIAPVYMLLPRIGRELIHWIGGSIDAMRTFRGYNTEPNISM